MDAGGEGDRGITQMSVSTSPSPSWLRIARTSVSHCLLFVGLASSAAAQSTTADSIQVGPGAAAGRRTLGVAVPAERPPELLRRRPAASLLDLVGSGLAGVDLARAGGTVGIGGRPPVWGGAGVVVLVGALVVGGWGR